MPSLCSYIMYINFLHNNNSKVGIKIFRLIIIVLLAIIYYSSVTLIKKTLTEK